MSETATHVTVSRQVVTPKGKYSDEGTAPVVVPLR